MIASATPLAAAAMQPSEGLLGDTPLRDYSRKLNLFNAFAESELRQLIAGLGLTRAMRVLDAGCGTGEVLGWLLDVVGPEGTVAGVDLSAAHVAAARQRIGSQARVMQADLMDSPLMGEAFDLVWCVNTINHLRDPLAGVARLATLLLPGGRIALGQSSLVPDMFFAWDSRLERLTNEAVYRYYRDRYGLDERDLNGVRSLVGLLRRAQLRNVAARTVMIERLSPLGEADEAYLFEAMFRDTWGQRLQPYLAEEDYAQLMRLCDREHAQYALRRPDFHYLQSFTLVVGQL
jgi:SAM-dependent methyltransferase